MKVIVATTYHNALCGLCGNFNNDPKDDLMLASGKAASNAKEFGISQWLASVPGCSHECKARVNAFFLMLISIESIMVALGVKKMVQSQRQIGHCIIARGIKTLNLN